MAIDFLELKKILNHASLNGAPSGGAYDSACVFLLLFQPADPHLLAILKTDNEGYPWRNQVALPGGRADEEDNTPLDTAFRELEEELNIPPDQVEVIGTTGHFQTINFVDIQVFVGQWNGRGPIVHDTSEVARVLKIPFKTLFQTHVSSQYHECDPDITNLIYPFADVHIWGATARILYHFLELTYPVFESEFAK